VPLGLAVELCVNGLAAQAPIWQPPPGTLANDPLHGPINTLLLPSVRADAYTRPTRIARFLKTQPPGRYLSSDPSIWDPRGYHVRQRTWYWGLLGMQQSMLWDRNLEEGQGYNPAQELRYWSFVRAVEAKTIRYNGAAFERPPPVALDLLQVRWLVGRTNSSLGPPAGTTPALRDGHWTLYRVTHTVPRATVIGTWAVVGSPDDALRAVRSRTFDPGGLVMLEQRPTIEDRTNGLPPSGPVGTASFRWNGFQRATVDVTASRAAIVLIRNSFDPGWHATVDGRPAPLLAADEIDQGVAVPAGRHTIVLTYDDPSVGYGLAGSAVVLLVLAVAAIVLRRRPRWDGPSRSATG
jgi:hypothetical protein